MDRTKSVRNFLGRFTFVLMIAAATMLATVAMTTTSTKPSRPDAQTARTNPQLQLIGSLDNLPLTFERNDGQTDPHVKFISRGAGYTLLPDAD